MRRRGWLIGLVLGIVLGAVVAAGLLLPGLVARWLDGGPDPQTIAQTSLRTVQQQARMTVLAARFTAVVTSEQQRFGGILSAKKTLIVPGTVRYEIDWQAVRPGALRWDAATKTLSVTLSPPVLAGPEIDLLAMREYRDGTLLFALTDAERVLDTANRTQVAAALLADARAPALLEMARAAASAAVARTFLLPLAATGIDGARVVVTFA